MEKKSECQLLGIIYLKSQEINFFYNKIIANTVDPRFSDTKFSDNPWYSDSFAADHLLI